MKSYRLILGILGPLLAGTLIGGWLSPALADDDTSNPYRDIRISRLSLIEGEVLVQRGDDTEWMTTSVNLPLRPHDKLWTSDGARAEVQFDDGSMIRLAENTSLDLLDFDPARIQVQVTLGVATFMINFPSRASQTGAVFEIDTPQVAAVVNRSGKFRIDVAEDSSTVITVREGAVDLSTDENPITVVKNQQVEIDQSEPPHYLLQAARDPDDWDQWNADRDRQIAMAASRRYLPPTVAMGVGELDTYGTWITAPGYGWVWMPQVSVGWAPYQYGRWVWIEPWGWTWVSYEPWGWVPYHHGRWVVVSGSWVWVPGPPREVWAPGYVRFIYGPTWVAWVPLGPREVYYYNPRPSVQVNVTLINYRVPGAVSVLHRQTFLTAQPAPEHFVPPADPIREGRVMAGPPPLVPVRASLRSKPQEEAHPNLQPPPIIHRPVVYHHPVSSPPAPFEKRIKEVDNIIQQGRPPIVATPRAEVSGTPKTDDRNQPERIHKDIVVRKEIRKPEEKELSSSSIQEPRPHREPKRAGDSIKREQPRPLKHPEASKELQGHNEARPLYRKPPQPAKREQRQ